MEFCVLSLYQMKDYDHNYSKFLRDSNSIYELFYNF